MLSRVDSVAGDAASVHHALFYRTDEEYLDGVRGFVEPGLTAGDPVVIAVPSPRLDLLHARLGDADVELIDMHDFGRNPGRIIAGVRALVDSHGGRLVHYVGEPIWPGRSAEEICEATRHEALINLAFTDVCIRVLCPYDAAELDEQVLADAECTHSHLVDGGAERASRVYTGHVPPPGCDTPLAAPTGDVATLCFELSDLARLRALVTERAVAAGLSATRTDDVVLAVNEVATNSIRYANAGGTLRVWQTGGRLTCEIHDAGHIADPLAGRRPPTPGTINGRGLWMVHQLCDLVETRTSIAGTSVRLHACLT